MAGAAISWNSKKQRTVALSSAEAEYMSLSDGTKEAKFLRSVMSELMQDYSSILIYNDNQSAQTMSRNHMLNKRTKHIDIRFYFIREALEDGSITLEYLPTRDMAADVMTKSLAVPKHRKMIEILGPRERPKDL
ncbi:hypothetical protein ILUMI_23925 [Ignelater luminosus]|uniref:Copia protein n=1 Tax=Ignelater luminosus TaxID=2038154 RepID=A0A8K0CBK6_IGNLU|nr:hypothetical protein ILUMI_23925 [Ignelater luminosus]